MRLSLYWLARNKPYALVLLTGLMLAASFPPSPLWPLAFVSFVPLFVLIETIPARVFEDRIFFPIKVVSTLLWQLITLPLRLTYWLATEYVFRTRPKGSFRILGVTRRIISADAQLFRYFYLTFLIWNLLCCYWLSFTALGAFSLEEALMNFSSGFFAVVLNPFLMYLPVMAFLWMRKRDWHPALAAFLFVPFWITFEFLHFRWDLSWSWLTIGHSLSYAPFMIQYAEFTGVLGIGIHIICSNIFVFGLLRAIHNKLKKEMAIWSLGFALCVSLPFMLNPFILDGRRDVFQSQGSLKVRLVQPNIDPFQKWQVLPPSQQVQRFHDLILSRPCDSIDLVVLPETAIPRGLKHDELYKEHLLLPLRGIADSFQLSILTGYTEVEVYTREQKIPNSATEVRQDLWVDHFNAAVCIWPGGESPSYRKSKMVPLVERMPFLDFFSFLKKYHVDLGGGFSNYGLPDSVQPLSLTPRVKASMMICYESEFGDFVRRQTKQGANMMAIITNDGWWSNTSGYIQHAQLSVLRAIENRRDIARCANTGRSQFVDSKGNVSGKTGWWQEAVSDGEVKLYDAQTFYVKWGDWPGYICLLLSVGMIAFRIRQNRKQKYANPES